MFDNLMGNMESQKEEMAKQLSQIPLKVEREGIVIEGNANREISDITIDDRFFQIENKEELQDLMISAIATFNHMADEEQGKITQNMLDNLFQGGLGGMFGQ